MSLSDANLLDEEVYVCVVGEDDVEQANPMEVPAEADGTILLSSITAHFAGATGLKYKPPGGKAFRGVKIVNDVLHPPASGWGDLTYTVSVPAGAVKRPAVKDDNGVTDATPSKSAKQDDSKAASSSSSDGQTSDLIVLGLPFSATDEEVKSFFETFGELTLCDIKKKPNGKSKGFAFIHYKSMDAQNRVTMQRHQIGDRWCDVKVPESRGSRHDGPSGSGAGYGDSTREYKIFVARIGNSITEQDLRSHFEQFGEITDLFYPKPPRGFAFVTFKEARVAKSLVGKDHILKGCSIHMGEPQPKESKFSSSFGDYRSGGGDGGYGGRRGGGYRGSRGGSGGMQYGEESAYEGGYGGYSGGASFTSGGSYSGASNYGGGKMNPWSDY